MEDTLGVPAIPIERVLVDQGKEFCWSGGHGEKRVTGLVDMGKRVLLVWWTKGKESSAGLVDMGKIVLVDMGKRVLLVWWTWGKEREFCWSGGSAEKRVLLAVFVIIDHRTSGNFDPWLMFALSGPRRWARGTWSGRRTTAWRRSCR